MMERERREGGDLHEYLYSLGKWPGDWKTLRQATLLEIIYQDMAYQGMKTCSDNNSM